MRVFSLQSISLMLALLFAIPSNAQKDPIKWGKIPDEDLAMTVYEPDTSASAVVLCNYGELQFNFMKGDIRYDFRQHKRIKILKRSGFDEGDVSIPFYHNAENIRNLQVKVFSPDGSEYNVKNSDIFEEKVSDNWSLMKFSAGNLSEGAVLEYRYILESEFFNELREWYFQENIPTIWSEYRLEVPEWFDYVAITQGQPADIHETDSQEQSITMGGSSVYTGSSRAKTKVYVSRYAAEHVPALKEEGFITTMDDYYSRVRFQLKGTNWPGQGYKPHMSTWPALAQKLMEYESVGEQISKDRNFKDLWKAVSPQVSGVDDNDEKVRIIYNFLATEMEWDGRYTFSATDKLDKCFEKKTATSGELNLMFIGLAQKMGIEVYPIMVSTRSHGRMVDLYPIIDQFNHLMALVRYGEQLQIVDIGSKHRPIGLSRISSFNNKAWLLSTEKPQWIQLPVPQRESIMMINAQLSETGELDGEVQSRYKGYAAVDTRIDLEEESQDQTAVAGSSGADEGEEEKGSLRDRYPDIEITAADYSGLEDPEAPLNLKFHCRIPGAAMVNNDFIYFSPVIFPAFDENPFKQEKRTYPVDVPYTIDERYVINLKMPDGYDVEELPEDIRMVLPDSGGSFEISTKVVGQDIYMNCNLKLNQIHFQSEEYSGLKKFIDLVMEKQGEQIVLRKKT
ncbi:DUF3857 domain-containing protein [Flavilitoribacter nigricans]|uniref:DUF3857 domain-containing protein n=1 Tax=Flavilitoribacter nigricans (strain ATCC 23147 / DSM 23189 / NBRC 102662 / NCIMB 1420 / SS-2) TaxID=1122177 RepID=A0A2D0N3T5_FLAN2|nr:DUF3857 domain-containing protein [Flavilitoribacter nigricans]PHN03036.1 hypothetical protein CRP01_28545 [Flavilitoribacter nigricans DSM 23189 = NBRC 102662]